MQSRQQSYKNGRGYIYYAQVYNPNESNSQQIQVQYEIEGIISHRFKSNSSDYLTPHQIQLLQKPLLDIPDEELQYLVKWVGHDQNSWEPGQNLKNAPQILESYKIFHTHNKDMSNFKNSVGKTRGRKPKGSTSNIEKCRTSKRRNLNFQRIYKQSDKLKICEDEDELEIIDKDTYIKGIKEVSNQQKYSKAIHDQEENIEHAGRLKKKTEKIDEEENKGEIDLNYYNVEPKGEKNIQLQGQQEQNIQHQSISSSQPSLINKNQCLFEVEAVVSHLPSPLPRVRQRSIMITQEEKYHDQQNPTKNKQTNKGLDQNCIPSPTQELISLFVSKKQKEKAIDSIVQKKNSQFGSYQQAMEFKHSLAPFIQPLGFQRHNIEDKSEQIQLKSLKRDYKSLMPAQIMDEHLIKKIKPNEGQQGIQIIAIDVGDDEPIHQMHIDKMKPLGQKIQKQVNNIIEGSIQPVQIRRDEGAQPEIGKAMQISDNMGFKQSNCISCISCSRHEEYNNQLKHLFNELLQSSPEINLDHLFLQQQTFSVLSSLNPHRSNYGAPSIFIRTDKMADISDNSSFRLLISRKIVSTNEIPQIKKHYSLQKLIKMGDQWVAIFKTSKLSQKRQHFKYVLAADLANSQRQLLVQFLRK